MGASLAFNNVRISFRLAAIEARLAGLEEQNAPTQRERAINELVNGAGFTFRCDHTATEITYVMLDADGKQIASVTYPREDV